MPPPPAADPVPSAPPAAVEGGVRGPRWMRWFIVGGVGAALAAVTLLTALLAWLAPQLPSLDPVLEYKPRQPMQVFTADGVEIGTFGAERRQFVPLEKIPAQLKRAVLAVEDTRFYEHRGIDLVGIGRAFVAQLSGGMRQGASTITQQVARTFFLSQRFSFERKLKEFMLALEIDRRLPKDRILELYLNQIYLGQRSYGFAAAADAYFGKTLDELTIAETAMLAGMPQNPAFANPMADPERAQQRQRVVLQRMLAEGVITPAQQQAARADVLSYGRRKEQSSSHAEYVAELARRAMVDRFGDKAYERGLKITTSVVSTDQDAAWEALRNGVLSYDARQVWRGPEDFVELPREDSGPEFERAIEKAMKDLRDDEVLRPAIVLAARGDEVRALVVSGERIKIRGDGLRAAQSGLAAKASEKKAVRRGAVIRVAQPREKGPWQIVQWPEVQAALVSLDANTGRVKALVGGFDFAAQPFNHVTQAWRQPGSSFKPFLYSAAMETGVLPATIVNDEEMTFPNGWEPQNYDGRFDGPISLRKGLARSKNMVSIRLLQHIGIGRTLDWAQRFGFDRDKHPADFTLALGAGGVTPLQMAAGYGVFANGGWYVPPVVVEKVVDANGNVVFQAPPAPERVDANRAIPATNLFITNSMLYDVARWGTAARAQSELRRRDLYGKTGTTNDSFDAWFAGFRPGLVTVVWMGYDQPASLGARETGGGLALPIWIDYMDHALRKLPELDTPKPPKGVVHDGGDWALKPGPTFVKAIGIDPKKLVRRKRAPQEVETIVDSNEREHAPARAAEPSPVRAPNADTTGAPQ